MELLLPSGRSWLPPLLCGHDVAADEVREVGHSEVDFGILRRQVVDLGEFLLCPGETDF